MADASQNTSHPAPQSVRKNFDCPIEKNLLSFAAETAGLAYGKYQQKAEVTINVGTSSERAFVMIRSLKPNEAREIAATLIAAADFADGKDAAK